MPKGEGGEGWNLWRASLHKRGRCAKYRTNADSCATAARVLLPPAKYVTSCAIPREREYVNTLLFARESRIELFAPISPWEVGAGCGFGALDGACAQETSHTQHSRRLCAWGGAWPLPLDSTCVFLWVQVTVESEPAACTLRIGPLAVCRSARAKQQRETTPEAYEISL